MRSAGVPIIPGHDRAGDNGRRGRRLGDELGWPVAIKASAGGGGKGFPGRARGRRRRPCVRDSAREGEAYFSDPTVYVEKYLEDPRHVEVQVLATRTGT
jgi:acetyl-CoA/propionyl-CoA carboxylase biotin carboxyl carrier protein